MTLRALKPLPPALVARLQRLASRYEKKPKRLYGAFGGMKNADSRSPHYKEKQPYLRIWQEPTRKLHGRVREMNIRRNFPKTRLVLKRTHLWGAQTTIQKIHEIVERHNKKFGQTETDYILAELPAVAVAEDIIAMPRIGAPAIAYAYLRPTEK